MLQYATVCCSMLHIFLNPQKYHIKYYLHPKIKFYQNQIYILVFLKYAAKIMGMLQNAAAATSDLKVQYFDKD